MDDDRWPIQVGLAMYVLTDVQDISGKPGDVLYLDAMEHTPENVSDAPFELIAVELKS
jgi:hypothetical protein